MVKIKKDKLSNNINLFADIWGVNTKPKRKPTYSSINHEWKVEFFNDDYGVDYGDTLLDLLHYKKQSYGYMLILIRYKCNSFDGDTSESYAYPENNKMPTKFEDGIKVPKRFLVEYEKVWK